MKKTRVPMSLFVVFFVFVTCNSLYADWQINEIELPQPYTDIPWYHNMYDIDDFGNLIFSCSYTESGLNEVTHYALMKYTPFPVGTVTIIDDNFVNGNIIGYCTKTFGVMFAYTKSSDVFWYDGADVTNVSNTPYVGETIIGVAGESIYYFDEVNHKIYHAIFSHTTGTEPMLSCDTANAFGYKLDSDLNNDCYVDLDDLAKLASEWLECNAPDDDSCVHSWLE